MKAKEFLNRAFFLNERINSKIEQIKELENMAEKVTSTFSQVPVSGSHNDHRMEDIVIKILCIEEELREDMFKLLDAKTEVMHAIDKVDNIEQRNVLELRYLCLKQWDEIAGILKYGRRNVFLIHNAALKTLEAVLETLH